MCAVDVNNDGLDDLIVGAPFYSKYEEEGRVHVFLSEGIVSERFYFKKSVLQIK